MDTAAINEMGTDCGDKFDDLDGDGISLRYRYIVDIIIKGQTKNCKDWIGSN